MTVFVGQEMVNFPAPQKLDPKISPHGTHTIYDTVCGAGKLPFPAPQKLDPKPKTVVFSMFMQNLKQQA